MIFSIVAYYPYIRRFWDWSSRNAELYGLPQIIHKPQVTVRGPNDSKILLSPNPLAFYEFSEIPAGVDKLPPEYETKYNVHFKQWKRTYRWAYKTEGVDDPWAEDYEKLNEYVFGPTSLPSR